MGLGADNESSMQKSWLSSDIDMLGIECRQKATFLSCVSLLFRAFFREEWFSAFHIWHLAHKTTRHLQEARPQKSDILALKHVSNIIGHCNNPALLVSHFHASIWALNRRSCHGHKPDRKAVVGCCNVWKFYWSALERGFLTKVCCCTWFSFLSLALHPLMANAKLLKRCVEMFNRVLLHPSPTSSPTLTFVFQGNFNEGVSQFASTDMHKKVDLFC